MFAYSNAPEGESAGFAVVTDRFLCVLGAETSAAAARELYRLLDGDAVHIDDVLDTIAARYELERFAIVEMLDAAERRMHVAVHGGVTVDIVGSATTRLSGPAGATWITGEARGVSALTLSLDGSEPEPEPASGTESEPLPIRRGIVRAHSITIDDLGGESDAPAFVDEPTPLTVPIDVPRIQAALTAGTETEAVPEIPVSTRAVKVDMSALIRDSDVATLLVRLPDGNRLDALTPIVVGRRPWNTDADTQSAVHVAVPSPLREVSGVHLEVAIVEGELRARDLRSTNGTVVLSAERAPRLLDAGRSTPLAAGDVLDVGEGFQIEIVTGYS